jgi:hypothetical protein
MLFSLSLRPFVKDEISSPKIASGLIDRSAFVGLGGCLDRVDRVRVNMVAEAIYSDLEYVVIAAYKDGMGIKMLGIR